MTKVGAEITENGGLEREEEGKENRRGNSRKTEHA
jgi:hypothetical protein